MSSSDEHPFFGLPNDSAVTDALNKLSSPARNDLDREREAGRQRWRAILDALMGDATAPIQ